MNDRRSVNGDRERDHGLDLGGIIGMDSKFASTVSYVPLKSIQPYRTQDEFLVAMREDLAEWFNVLYHLNMEESTLFQHLSTGVLLCQHANAFNEAVSFWFYLFKENPAKLITTTTMMRTKTTLLLGMIVTEI